MELATGRPIHVIDAFLLMIGAPAKWVRLFAFIDQQRVPVPQVSKPAAAQAIWKVPQLSHGLTPKP